MSRPLRDRVMARVRRAKRKGKRIERAPGARTATPRHGGLVAFPCQCADPGCTGWRGAVHITGGGHMPRADAIELLQLDRDGLGHARSRRQTGQSRAPYV